MKKFECCERSATAPGTCRRCIDRGDHELAGRTWAPSAKIEWFDCSDGVVMDGIEGVDFFVTGEPISEFPTIWPAHPMNVMFGDVRWTLPRGPMQAMYGGPR